MPEEGIPPRADAPTPEERAKEYAAAAEAGAAGNGAPQGSEIDRRDFLGFLVGTTGGLALGALTGFGIAHWTMAEEEGLAIVTAPTEGTSDMLVLYPRVPITSLSALQVGVPVAFEYPLVGQTAQLVKLGRPAQYGLGPDADIVAFSTKCTHMGWPLDNTFNPDECVFGPCPGHFSTFDATVGGQVTMGQASVRLPQVVLVIENDMVYAEGVLGLIYGYRQNIADGVPVGVTT